jgi:hypothetical protein
MGDQFAKAMQPRQIPTNGATDVSLAAYGTELYLIYTGFGDPLAVSATTLIWTTIILPTWQDWPTANWMEGNEFGTSEFAPWITASQDPWLTLIAQSETGGFNLGCQTYKGYAAWLGGIPDVPGNTSQGGAAAYYNGKLWVAWRGIDPDPQVYLSVYGALPTPHGRPPIFAWSGAVPVTNATSSNSPALAVCNGSLYLAWKGAGNDMRIFYSTYDGAFSQPRVVPGAQTGTAPMLCAQSPTGPLYCCWSGAAGGGAPGFNCSQFGPGPDSPAPVWSGPTIINGSVTNARPAMAFCGGAAYVAWADPDGSMYWGLFNAMRS